MEPTQQQEDSVSEKINEKNPKKRRSKNARRFSDEQIKSLETIFEVETKLEPRKKLQVAKDLGLQPRQVAIWFQNRRARWKSKQIEQDYGVLKANYDSLYLKFDDLKREKQSLQMQLQELSVALKNHHKVDLSDRDEVFKHNPESSNEGMDHIDNTVAQEDEKMMKRFEKTEEEEILSWDEEEEISQLAAAAAPEDWCNISSGGLFDQCSSTSDWWENE